jgi:hypothetical protein
MIKPFDVWAVQSLAVCNVIFRVIGMKLVRNPWVTLNKTCSVTLFISVIYYYWLYLRSLFLLIEKSAEFC